jgi:hypothetical protein
MNTADEQTVAKSLIAAAMAEGEAGRLDWRVYEALKRTIVIQKPMQSARRHSDHPTTRRR